MANRPVFIVENGKSLFQQVDVEFKFFNGFSVLQKAKSINSLHKEFLDKHQKKVLEVSTIMKT